MHELPPIYVAVVLYRTAISDSPTCTSLRQCLASVPGLASRLQILLVDNSPKPQATLEALPSIYLHDGMNPGLARRYNEALRRAEAAGCRWLLLLDDDTTLVASFFEQLLAQLDILEDQPRVVAIVPRLVRGEQLLSPHHPSFQEVSFRLDVSSSGEMSGLVRVFNSGAALRVSALRRIGGFDERFWLDSLDHATFHALQELGGRIVLLNCSLSHELSTGAQSPARHRNQLAAETAFYRLHGTTNERSRRRNFLLRQTLKALGHGRCAEGIRLLRTAMTAGRA